MGRFETEVLATSDNRSALVDLSGQWIDRVHERKPPKWITLDMDSSVSPTHGAQEGTAWNGHFGCMCYHPLFVFNQFGHLERCALRPGNVHSADGWEAVLKPVIARYADHHLMRFFRGGCCVCHSGAIQNSRSGKILLCHSPAHQPCSAGQDCASAQAPSGSPTKGREAHLRRLRVSGGIMGQTTAGRCQGRMASRRVVPPRRLCCHQPANGTRLDHPVLQSAWHGGAAYQGRQTGDQLSAVLPAIPVAHACA